MTDISSTQQELVRLVKAGDQGSPRYKRLVAKVRKRTQTTADTEAPSLSPWTHNHIYGHPANHRKRK